VERLLAHGAASSKDKIYGFTPLMLAARQGHASVIKLLLAQTNDVNDMDIHGETALFDATRNNNVDCVKLLIQVLIAGSYMSRLYLNCKLYVLSYLFTHLSYFVVFDAGRRREESEREKDKWREGREGEGFSRACVRTFSYVTTVKILLCFVNTMSKRNI